MAQEGTEVEFVASGEDTEKVSWVSMRRVGDEGLEVGHEDRQCHPAIALVLFALPLKAARTAVRSLVSGPGELCTCQSQV